MRRHALLIGMLISQLPCTTLLLPAQDTPVSPPPIRQDNDDNYKSLNTRVEDLAAANESLQKNLNKLRDDVQKLADEVARASDKSKDSATTESIKALKAAIEEVDKKRIEDQKLVLEKLEAFRKILEKPIAGPRPNPTAKDTGNGSTATAPKRTNSTTPARTDTTARTAPENGYNYSIQDGDILSTIVAKLKKQGMKITMKQIMDANPKVNWNKLQVNQVIFIPAPQP